MQKQESGLQMGNASHVSSTCKIQPSFTYSSVTVCDCITQSQYPFHSTQLITIRVALLECTSQWLRVLRQLYLNNSYLNSWEVLHQQMTVTGFYLYWPTPFSPVRYLKEEIKSNIGFPGIGLKLEKNCVKLVDNHQCITFYHKKRLLRLIILYVQWKYLIILNSTVK